VSDSNRFFGTAIARKWNNGVDVLKEVRGNWGFDCDSRESKQQ